MQPGYGPFPQAPLCLALVLARSVSYSVELGAWSIVSPYLSLTVEAFPVEFVALEAYVVLTACDVQVLVELRLVDVDEARPPVFRQLISATFNGPLDVQEIVFHHHKVRIPVEGDYRLMLTVYRPNFTHPEFVIERRIPIQQFEEDEP